MRIYRFVHPDCRSRGDQCGIFIGVAAAHALTGAMSKLLFNVSSTDPITFAATSVLIALVSCAATYIPRDAPQKSARSSH